jgi:cytoskeletal protein RodZ
MSALAIPSSEPTIAGTLSPEQTYGYKELPQRQDRWQLWIAVVVATVVIFGVWLYIAQLRLVNFPTTVSTSIESSQVENLVTNVQSDYSQLKDNLKTLANTASQISDEADPTNDASNSPTTLPTTNNELNNLFSDLQ